MGESYRKMIVSFEPSEQVDEKLPWYESSLRRPIRERKTPARYSSNEYVMLINAGDPKTFQEAIAIDHKVG